MREFNYLIAVIGWLFGIVMAKGWVSTSIALVLPVYAWYLTMEKAVTYL
jgi:hypothetical protein